MEIIADEITIIASLAQVLLGFGAGIVGGIVGFRYQRRHDRMAATAEARRHYRARLTGWMDDIVTFWNAEKASGLSFESVQRKADVFARRIAKDLSAPPVPLRPEITAEFRDLLAALDEVRDLDPAAGEIDHLRERCRTAVEKAKRIRALAIEWFAAE